jgi:hypothetical protein
VLFLEKPYDGTLRLEGVRLPDGSLVMPEVQVVDSEGTAHELELNRQFGTELLVFTIPQELKGKEFRQVRVRSEKPVNCKEIFWRCYYVKDVD